MAFYLLCADVPLKPGFHYHSSRPELTPSTRVHFLTPVNSGRQLKNAPEFTGRQLGWWKPGLRRNSLAVFVHYVFKWLCVCVVLVVSQALLQAHNPDIQAKLLAMQRQMQLSGVAIPADTPAATGRSFLTHDLPASVAAVPHSRVMTAEQKEEQTRWVFAISSHFVMVFMSRQSLPEFAKMCNRLIWP